MIPHQWSFNNGLSRIPPREHNKIEARIRAALGIKNGAYLNRKNGKVEPLVSEKETIEGIFAEFGVTNTGNVWGTDPAASTN